MSNSRSSSGGEEPVRENPVIDEIKKEVIHLAPQNVDLICRDKKQELEQKVFISALMTFQAEFRSFYEKYVHEMKRNGYAGQILAFPEINMTMFEDAKKSCIEERQETLGQPLEELSMLPNVQANSSASATALASTTYQMNVLVKDDYNSKPGTKCEGKLEEADNTENDEDGLDDPPKKLDSVVLSA